VFPLQVVLLLGWIAYRYASKKPPDWPALFLGGAGTFALAYPFITYFAAQALSTPIKWVTLLDRTPLDRFVIILWPALVVMILAALVLRRQRLSALLIVVFALLLLCSELFYADDPMGEKFNRFNSTLKWWSWIYPGVLLGLGSMLLGAGRWQRGSAVVVLLLVSTFSVDLVAYWMYSEKPSLGKFSGHYWLTKDQVDRQILNWLTVAPDGVVLEGLEAGGGYMPSAALSLFAGRPVAIGWPSHEAQRRDSPGFIASYAEQARSFYRGTLPDAPAWLALSRVRYILWTRRDEPRDLTARRRIHEQISSAYRWKPFWVNGEEELGIWVRKD
jgi:uncharacterized membrane protein